MKYVAYIALFCALGIVGGMAWQTFSSSPDEGAVACTADARICEDGSSVGRVGPSCEFAECPPAVSTSTPPVVTPVATTTPDTMPVTLTLGVGQSGRVGGMSIVFNRVVQDNRCPLAVQCIQAGSVIVTLTLTEGAHTDTDNLASDEEAKVFESHSIAIKSVSPARRGAEDITPGAYQVTFVVSPRASQ